MEILNKLVVNFNNYVTSNKVMAKALKDANVDLEAEFCAIFSSIYNLEL